MVNSTAVRALTFAHSPDPDDAFMFYGFAKKVVHVPGCIVNHHLEDIQSLNERAFRGEFEITAVSAHAYAYLADRYWVLNCGASVGRGYGPMLVARSHDLANLKTIAIPGQWTTAALVLKLWLKDQGIEAEQVVLPFDKILPAVESGQVSSGLLIHEGQLTYGEHGLVKIWDSGVWWQEKNKLPLPLGLDIVRQDLGEPLAKQISFALRESIQYANAHSKEALDYALQYGRGLNPALGRRFVGMYVNDDTLNQGKEVQRGLDALYTQAHEAGIIPNKPFLKFL